MIQHLELSPEGSPVERFLTETHPHRQLPRVRCLTVSHLHATAEVRALFALSEAERCRFYVRLQQLLAERPRLEAEVLLLATCNRTEIYVAARYPEGTPDVGTAGELEDGPDIVAQTALAVLAEIKGLTADDLALVHALQGAAAARHLCEVAAGLQSVVLGETQILQQLKDAFALAHAHEACGPVLHTFVHLAFKAGRRVRTETGINLGQVSVASAGVERARDFFACVDDRGLRGRTALLVGTGKIGRLTVRQLLDSGIGRLVIANRTPEPAFALAEEAARQGIPAEVCALKDVPARLPAADLVITAVGADGQVSGWTLRDHALEALHARCTADPRPTLIVDLGMPANITADVAALPGVTRVGLDDLDQRCSGTRQRREACLPAAREIIDAELADLEDRDGAIRESVLTALYRHFADIGRCEAARQGRYGLPQSEEELTGFALRLVRKLLAPVSSRQRHQLSSREAEHTLDNLQALVALFGIQPDTADADAGADLLTR